MPKAKGMSKERLVKNPSAQLENELDGYPEKLLEKLENGELTASELLEEISELDEEKIEVIIELLGETETTIRVAEDGEPGEEREYFLSQLRSGRITEVDPVKIYFKEAASAPLLSAEEEVELAQRIELGKSAEKKLESDEEKDEDTLRKVVEDANKARARLIHSNTRLVISIAKRYSTSPLPFLDLIQEGNIGLMKAAEKFKWRKGYKFSTYASWWIKQTITKAIEDKGRTIRLPMRIHWDIRKIVKARRALEQELQRTPTDEEIRERTNISEGRYRLIVTKESASLSLEMLAGENGDAELGDFIKDESIEDPLEAVAKQDLMEEIDALLRETLTEREREIVLKRFGLNGFKRKTLKSLEDDFGLTSRRIGQIERGALKKLRENVGSKKLAIYLNLDPRLI